MIAFSTILRGRIRLKRRSKIQTPLDLRIPTRRRTLLDKRFLTGDAGVENVGCGLLAVCVDENCLACIRGEPLDLPYLNQLVDRLWHRPPSARR
jgi:hypothetical protein